MSVPAIEFILLFKTSVHVYQMLYSRIGLHDVHVEKKRWVVGGPHPVPNAILHLARGGRLWRLVCLYCHVMSLCVLLCSKSMYNLCLSLCTTYVYNIHVTSQRVIHIYFKPFNLYT